jgi:FAD/FMN-containing dehydrogenase
VTDENSRIDHSTYHSHFVFEALSQGYVNSLPRNAVGQLNGHTPLSTQYSLGSDHFLEAKVVTTDGNLVIANKVSNSDLFWALRGGGGGTFGVVVEATIKAYADIPETEVVWFVNSISSLPNSVDESLTHLYNQLLDLREKGISGYIEGHAGSAAGLFFHAGKLAAIDVANKLWKPILERCHWTFHLLLCSTDDVCRIHV